MSASKSILKQHSSDLGDYTGGNDTTAKAVKEVTAPIAGCDLSLEEALHCLPIGFSIFDANHKLAFCNKRYRELFDLPQELTAPGTAFGDILRYHIETKNGRPLNDEEKKGINNWLINHAKKIDDEKSFSQINQSFDSRFLRAQYTRLAPGGWVDLQEDITEKLQSDRKVSFLATHDALTRIENRRSYRVKLNGMLTRSRKGDTNIGVILIDLDGFKSINDTFGHPFADKVLIMVAQRLRSALRSTSVLARLGGDEFAIAESMERGAIDAAIICKRLLSAFEQPFRVDGVAVPLTASLGVALAPQNGTKDEELMKNADLALYRSKKVGGNTFHFFEKEMDVDMRKRLALESDLRSSIKDGDFILHYQPIAKVDSGEIAGCEALLRWEHPKRGLVSPDDFIPVAEETGLMVQLGAWVLSQAFHDACKWPEDIRIAVNVSPVQLRADNFVENVKSALVNSGISPNRVELEITETAILEGGRDKIYKTLVALKELGLRVALDDFGTGFSSLSHVHSFPVDRIKIDGSFVQGLGDQPTKSLAIVRSLTQLANSLGMETTAECVENAEQLSVVQAEGCTEIQGYYFARPTTAENIGIIALSKSDPKSQS